MAQKDVGAVDFNRFLTAVDQKFDQLSLKFDEVNERIGRVEAEQRQQVGGRNNNQLNNDRVDHGADLDDEEQEGNVNMGHRGLWNWNRNRVPRHGGREDNNLGNIKIKDLAISREERPRGLLGMGEARGIS